MRALISTASSLLLIAATTLACSEPADDGGEDTTGGTGQGGSSGASTGGSATGGSSGAATGGASGASTGGAGMTGGASTGGSAGSATGGSGGSAGGAVTKTGICEQSGLATVDTTSYEGVENFYIISEETVDDGRTDDPMPADLVCHIRFEVTRSGEPTPGCADLEGVPCEWAHQVQFSNPEVVIDIDGACARSGIAWNAAWIDGIDGSQESYGYIAEYEGHQSTAMKYLQTMMGWGTHGRAFWEETTREFDFKNRLGACDY